MLYLACGHCAQTRRNPGRGAVSLVRCPDAGGANSATGIRTLHGIHMDFTKAVAIFISGELILRQGASTTFPLESASPSLSPLDLHHRRLTFMTGNHIGFVTLHLV